jgi:hypothetical protein
MIPVTGDQRPAEVDLLVQRVAGAGQHRRASAILATDRKCTAGAVQGAKEISEAVGLAPVVLIIQHAVAGVLELPLWIQLLGKRWKKLGSRVSLQPLLEGRF